MNKKVITTKAYSRVGLIGNPSDGFGGKTISIIIKNFWTTVKLWPSPKFEIILGEEDRFQFEDDKELVNHLKQNGYYGGSRLIAATISAFHNYCNTNGINIKPKSYSIEYNTNIPRQKGLAGSSAIVTATLKALMKIYNINIPKDKQPNLILNAEKKELGIAAGLQDRVVQVYESLVFMDFSKVKDALKDKGKYEHLDKNLLPPIFVAYINNGSEESGKVHSTVTERFKMGDKTVIEAMKKFAEYTDQAKNIILKGNPKTKWDDLGILMDQNFKTRKSIYHLRSTDINMIETAWKLGAHAKFAGSSGAAVGTYKDEEMFKKLKEAYKRKNITMFKPIL